VLTLIVTGIMSFTSYQNAVQLVNSANQVRQTNELLDALTDISTILAEAESRQWRYVLFGDGAELEQYQRAIVQLRPLLNQLRPPLADTDIQRQRLAKLEQLVYQRLDLFDQAIERYEGYPLGITSTDPLIIQYQTNLDDIRQIIRELESEEEKILAVQINQVRATSRARMLIEPIAAFISLMILIGVFTLLYRQLQKRQTAEALQRALAQEKELSELKLELFSMVSHEFRTPLSLILGSSQLLEDSLKNSREPVWLKNLHRIQASAKGMTQLLNDILTLARADAGKLEFEPAWIEIQTFCLNLLEDFQITNMEQRSLSFQQIGDRTHACVDEKILYSILVNLLSNATKYSAANSTVYFTLISQSDGVSFEIQDEGIGIPLEDQQYLYEPFWRGSHVKEIRGTGLGLAIVKKFVELHDGEIQLESQVGAGTRFTVKLPQGRSKFPPPGATSAPLPKTYR